jgi:bifunctional ADP-heptose synthase (sugar kinase/adenylyltransferase)
MSDIALRELLERFAEAKILVLGELWLEHTVRGEASRADGHVFVRAAERVNGVGGAAGIGWAAAAMGAKTCLAGVVGQDARAGELLRALGDTVDPFGIVSAPGCQTGERLVLSIDDSTALGCTRVEVELAAAPPLTGPPAQAMLDHVGALIGKLGSIVITTYGAPLEPQFSEALARLAQSHSVPVIGGLMSPCALAGAATDRPPLPQCRLLVAAQGAAADDSSAEARDLLDKGGHTAVLVGGADGHAQLYQAAGPDVESFADAALTDCSAWQAVVAGAALAVASGADIVTAARIGIGAAIVTRSGGPPTAAALERELTG